MAVQPRFGQQRLEFALQLQRHSTTSMPQHLERHLHKRGSVKSRPLAVFLIGMLASLY